jgi:hypothetical protein
VGTVHLDDSEPDRRAAVKSHSRKLGKEWTEKRSLENHSYHSAFPCWRKAYGFQGPTLGGPLPQPCLDRTSAL